MAELLIGPQRNLCAVGDADQTIYGWRGAQIGNILSFEKKFPGAVCVLLEENYRSTQNILRAANDVIAKNTQRLEKNLFTKNAQGDLLSLYIAFDERDEAGFIARTILEQMQDGKQPREFAVLYRANFQSRAIEEQLLHAGIPYQVLGTRFFERKEVKDALSFLRAALFNTPADVERVSNVPPRGIGKVTMLKIVMDQEEQLRGAVREKVFAFRELLRRIAVKCGELKASEIVRYVIAESGMERMLKDDKLEGAERLENLRELVSLAARYDHLPALEGVEAMLEAAALASDQDSLKESQNAVRLMTVHAAKGLEFPTVFITGLEEGLFPYARDDEKEEDREEERRLMYVALTRAQKKVYLSYASYRTIFGQKNPTIFSPFLSDIPGELLHAESPERLGKTIYLD
jgi:DNA helicase-2/ATP-dependent DNA helicase PcrA